MKKLLLTIGVIFLFSSVSFSQINVKETVKQAKPLNKVALNPSVSHSDNNIINTQLLPGDFPVLMSDSPSLEEISVYQELRDKWIVNNPKRYQELLVSNKAKADVVKDEKAKAEKEKALNNR